MRFYLPFVIVTALVGLAFANPIPSLETRQQPPEAVRFGVVNVEPTTFKVNEPFTVIYNSTFARWQPLTLDIYMHGVYPNGFVTPDFQLLRTDYPSDSHIYYLNTTLPVLADVENNGYLTDGAYGITAWITFATSTGAISRGGISSGFTIDFS